jgi:hypothetical protein
MAKRQIIQEQRKNQHVIPQRPQKPKSRFRSSLFLVPMSLLVAAWFLSSIRPSISWSGILYMLGIRNRERASMLIVLGITLLAILVIKRILVGGRKR